MSFLGFGKKDKVIDLTEGYKRKVKEEQEKKAQADSFSSDSSPFSFFDSPSSTATDLDTETGTPEERKKKLAKRIIDMTERLEDISNQLYHLQQRVEVLERKTNIRVE